MREDTQRLRTILILLLVLAIGISFLVNGCSMIVQAIQELNTPTPPPISRLVDFLPAGASASGFFF
ncbi:MAG: hypothetical protein H5T64_03445 [Chloroflexi bacterium]|nr:hypothetical protein [Chloroflexota bacterium]